MMIDTLRGAAVTLVPWREEHASELSGIANDIDVCRYLGPNFPHPYGLENALEWIALQCAATTPSNFAVETGGRLAGSIGAIPGQAERRGSAFVGYFLGKAYWGRGVATDALRTMTAHAFTLPGIYRTWANVMGPNAASMRVLEKAGYRKEAVVPGAIVDRFGTAHDEHIFAMFR